MQITATRTESESVLLLRVITREIQHQFRMHELEMHSERLPRAIRHKSDEDVAFEQDQSELN